MGQLFHRPYAMLVGTWKGPDGAVKATQNKLNIGSWRSTTTCMADSRRMGVSSCVGLSLWAVDSSELEQILPYSINSFYLGYNA